MAKKIEGYIKVAGSGRQGQSVAAHRSGARSARPEHHGVLQGSSTRRPSRWKSACRSRWSSPPSGDRTFTFITKTPPASYFLKKAAKIEQGLQGPPAAVSVGKVTMAQIREIAEKRKWLISTPMTLSMRRWPR